MTSSIFESLRTEFDRWAGEGRGEKMGDAHRAVTETVIGMMNLRPDSDVLDLGCGVGWATRLLASRIPDGSAVGLDISEEMISRARECGCDPPNVSFRVLKASRFPYPDGVFADCLSVESLYYHSDITATFREVHRVLTPGGAGFFLMNFCKENPYTHRWAEIETVPMQLLSGDEYCARALEAGFARCRHQLIPDPTPTPPTYTPKHYASLADMRASREIGSLVVIAEKD
jgi:arsenite methyltransferase